MLLLPLVLAGAACAQSQPQLSLRDPDVRKALGVAQLFARRLGMAGDCRTPGPSEHYSIKDAADSWIVEVEPPPRPGPGPVLRLTIGKSDFKVIRAQKIG